MFVFFKPTFIKDLKKVPVAIRSEIKKICKEIFPSLSNLQDIKKYNIKPIIGFKNYYRLRLGDYRIGLKIENGSVIFMRAKHRKEIYRHFP